MKKYNIIPAILAIYLAVMCYIGYPHYAAGQYSSLRYYGVTALSLACIIALRIVMKRRHNKRNNSN